MKTRNLIAITLLLAASSLAVMSCFPEDKLTYSLPSQVQFKNFTLGQSSAVLSAKGVSTAAADAQTDSTRTVRVNLRVTDSVLVQLVGPQRGTDLVLDFSVRSTSTAVEGTHYNFRPANARTVTIPANSSSAYILLDMIANSVTTGSKTVNIDLVGSSDVPAMKNYKAFFVTIKP